MSHDMLLKVDGLQYKYGELEVWNDLSFHIDSGEVVFLVGQNGSGKSTLLRCLAGQSRPSKGSIEFCGERFTGRDRRLRSKLSFISDTPAFYDDLTAEEHIRFILQARRRPHDFNQAEELLEEFGLYGHMKQKPSSYSRGMREKLSLVIALLVNPLLYILDEPYGPLDPSAAQLLSSKLEERAAQGSAVLLSCHHAVPDLIPDKTLTIERGTISEIAGSEGMLQTTPHNTPTAAAPSPCGKTGSR